MDEPILAARKLASGTRVHAIEPGVVEKYPVVVFLTKAGIVEDPAEIPMNATRVYFNPFTGEHLGTPPAPSNQTIGNWIIWSMVPVHFGNKWGLL